MKPLLFHLSSSGLDLSPDLVEYVNVGFHLLGEKIELPIAFPRWRDEIVLLQCPDVMLCDPIVNVKRFSDLVDIVRFFLVRIDDLAIHDHADGVTHYVP